LACLPWWPRGTCWRASVIVTRAAPFSVNVKTALCPALNRLGLIDACESTGTAEIEPPRIEPPEIAPTEIAPDPCALLPAGSVAVTVTGRVPAAANACVTVEPNTAALPSPKSHDIVIGPHMSDA